MRSQNTNAKTVSKQMLRLLPVQILLAAVGAINGIVSAFFASNYISVNAMTAVGLYAPTQTLIQAFIAMLSGGAAILCGQYWGRNQQDKVQNVFSLSILFALALGLLFTVLILALAIFDLTGLFTGDPAVRPLLNRYLMGVVVGLVPLMVSNMLPSFLAMENMNNLTIIASGVYIAVNAALDFLFVKVLHMETFGLALASSLGLWAYLAVQAHAFLSGKTSVRFQFKNLYLRDGWEILKIGLPGAVSTGYQALRGMIVNALLQAFVGVAAISAFAASNNLMQFFWAIPAGMLTVSRLMLSISYGEEDRQTLTDVMRVMFKRFIPMMCVVCAVIILCAEPFTRLFFKDPSEPVYMMTVWAFRILPLCMPLAIICMHFTCYAQTSGKQVFVHVVSLLDGVVCVAAFSALLVRPLGINAVYIANVLNGVVCLLFVLFYAQWNQKRFPTNMEQLMAIPDSFGAGEDARIDISVQNMDEVLTVSKRVTEFCRRRGIDERRVYLASLCMEEMAGNIVEHGFIKDNKSHSIDIRVIHKDDDIILRIRDDCVPFNPRERREITDSKDILKNAGIRIVYQIAKSVDYQNLLGMNVLTLRI